MAHQHDSGNIVVRSLAPDSTEFQLSGVEMAFANSLRRSMMADVPTVAIDQVLFKQNTSPLPDEFIAHRMGMIPLISTGIKANMRETRDCGCDEGCAYCMVELRLSVRCTQDQILSVSTAQLDVCPPADNGDPDDAEGQAMLRRRPRDFGQPIDRVALPDSGTNAMPIIITKLGKGQEIDIICKAYKGLSKHHGKWSPLSAVGYEYDPHNKLRHTSYWFEVDQKAEWPPMKSAAYEAEPEPDEPFDYNAKPGTFYIEAEGTGSMPVKDVVRLGFEALEDKLAPMILELTRAVAIEEGREVEDDGMNGNHHQANGDAAPLVQSYGAGMNGGYGGYGADTSSNPYMNGGGGGGGYMNGGGNPYR